MSKRKKSKQAKQQRNLYVIAAGVGLLVIAIFALIASRNVTSAAEHISPSAYVAQYVQTNTPHFLLDVRTPDEFASGHIHGAVNISVETLQDRLSEVPHDLPVIVYCHSGNRSAKASLILSQAGYTHIYDLGGINDWSAQGFPVE